jgi:hypothetical protein
MCKTSREICVTFNRGELGNVLIRRGKHLNLPWVYNAVNPENTLELKNIFLGM